jgi:tetratricopeptide (TPR) repeat protein
LHKPGSDIPKNGRNSCLSHGKIPTKSEYHRILGQILFEESNFDGTIDSLIDSLRWDPKNKWALLMMGNIFNRYKRNFTVAMQYYDQVLKIAPDDYINVNNIGGTLMEQGNYEEAKPYFLKSIEIS